MTKNSNEIDNSTPYYDEAEAHYDIFEALDRLEALYARREKPMTELRAHYLESEINVQLEVLDDAVRRYKFSVPEAAR